MLAGVIKDSKFVHKRKVSVNPVEAHYEDQGEEPYIKYRCPVCKAVGNYGSIPHGTKNCPLCGVSLNWDRKPQIGDSVIVHGGVRPNLIGSKGVVTKIRSDKTGKAVCYQIDMNDGSVMCNIKDFTILDEVIE